MKTIIIATDFSPAAENAAKYAADLAITLNAALLIFHSFQVPVSYADVPLTLSANDLRTDAEEDISKLKNMLMGHINNNLRIETVVEEGVFFSELKRLCERIQPYAVVMGSQGTSNTERLFFGSESVYTTKHLEWPVITVPVNSSLRNIKKIGLACDFDHVVETIPAKEIKRMVTDFKAELHILNTGTNDKYSPELVFQSGMLQEMIADLKPAYHFISNRNITEGIIEFADKNRIDLLIVVPKHHLLPGKLLSKSITKQFVLHSHVPVMVLHQ
ncbi:MAG: universal stress protein [Ferruginibacter sp.]